MDEQHGAATALAADLVPHAGQALDAEPVPHAEPFATETDHPVRDDELNRQIADAFGELMRHAHDIGQGIAAGFGLTVSDCKALFVLENPLTMKELGLKMGCDPSFVTSVADALEKHGLARREPSQRDRRSKTIVLTPEGHKLREKVSAEISARAPWCTTLDTGERQCLLGLVRKMLPMRGRR